MSDSISDFFDAWSVEDSADRLTAVTSAFASGGSYADPRTPAPMTDAAEISTYIGMFIEAAPGATVAVVKSDEQHGMTRATIAFRMANGMEQTGQYFVEHDADGKITRMIGFVGTGAPE